MTAWPVVTLDELQAPVPRAITDGPFGSNLTSAHYTDEGPQVVRLGNIGDGVYKDASAHISREHFETLRNHEVFAGDLLIASLGERLPRACLMPAAIGPAIVKADCIRVRLSDDVDHRWVMYSMQRPEARKWAEEHLHGIGRPRLGLKLIRQIPVPLPPLDEQRRIVEILEAHLTRLDEGAALLDRCQRQLAALDEAVIVEALGLGADTGRIVGDDLPSLPAGWRWSTLADVADVVGGVMKDAKKQADPAFVEVPYLRVANVQRARLDLSNVTSIRVPRAKADVLALMSGDVLMNEGGDRDKLARGWIWEGQIDGCIHQNHVFRARPQDDVRSEWLAWCANSYGSRWAQRHGKQSVNLASISLRTIRTMPIPVPPLEVQDERLNTLRNAVERNSRLRAEIASSRVRAEALRRSLLAAAFAGRLGGSESAVDAQMTELANHLELAPA